MAESALYLLSIPFGVDYKLSPTQAVTTVVSAVVCVKAGILVTTKFHLSQVVPMLHDLLAEGFTLFAVTLNHFNGNSIQCIRICTLISLLLS